METIAINQVLSRDSITLNELISRLLPSYQAKAYDQRNRLVNEVESGIILNSDAKLLSLVVSKLLNAILTQCRDCDIRVTSKKFHSVVLLHLTIINGFQGMHEVDNMHEINDLAYKLGGCIMYNNQHLKESTFSLSFSNFSQLAA